MKEKNVTHSDQARSDLDQTHFVLDADQFDAFMAMLDCPPPPNEKLKALFQTRAPWED